MISGTSKIWSKSGPVDLLIITEMLQEIQENYGGILKSIIFTYMDFKKCQIWKRRAPKNDEDPSKNFLKILDMGPI